MSELFWIVVGLGALLIGSEGVVRSGRAVAMRFGVSELALGLVVASIGTSLPELFTVAMAARGGGEDASAIGIGNVFGSNLFLLLFLLPLMAILRDMVVERRVWRRDGIAVALSSVALLVFGIDGRIQAWEGALLLVAFGVWLYRVAIEEREDLVVHDADGFAEAGGPPRIELPLWAEAVRGGAGLVLLVEGADLVVGQGVVLAEALGIGATLIGVLSGIGTSLPEIGVSIQAGRDGSSELSLGNMLGSALTNALLCTGVGALAGELLVPEAPLKLELPFLLCASVAALALMWERRDLTRAEGIALSSIFALYLALRIVWA